MEAAVMLQPDFKEHRHKYRKYYDEKVLRPETHFRLVEDMERIAAKAHIPPMYIAKSMKQYCGEHEIQWFKDLRKHRDAGVSGLCYVGNVGGIEDRMMSIAGACLRNFVDARFMAVQELIEALKANDDPSSRVVLVPNFYLRKEEGGNIPNWQSSLLIGWLYSRHASGKLTVLYVQDINRLATEYGPQFKSHIESHYLMIKK